MSRIRPQISQWPVVLSFPALPARRFHTPPGVRDGGYPVDRRKLPQTKRGQLWQAKPAERPGKVAQGVAAGVTVGLGVRGRADAEAVEDDDGGPPHQERGRLYEAEAEGGEGLIQQASLVQIQTAGGLVGQHAERVDQGLRHHARIAGALGARWELARKRRVGLMGQPEDERGEMRIHAASV